MKTATLRQADFLHLHPAQARTVADNTLLPEENFRKAQTRANNVDRSGKSSSFRASSSPVAPLGTRPSSIRPMPLFCGFLLSAWMVGSRWDRCHQRDHAFGHRHQSRIGVWAFNERHLSVEREIGEAMNR
jgi:hypothetical protein